MAGRVSIDHQYKDTFHLSKKSSIFCVWSDQLSLISEFNFECIFFAVESSAPPCKMFLFILPDALSCDDLL